MQPLKQNPSQNITEVINYKRLSRLLSGTALFLQFLAFGFGKIVRLDLKYSLFILLLLISWGIPAFLEVFTQWLNSITHQSMPWLKKTLSVLHLVALTLVNLFIIPLNSMLFRDRNLILSDPKGFWLGVITFFMGLFLLLLVFYSCYQKAVKRGYQFGQTAKRLIKAIFVFVVLFVVIFILEVFAGIFISLFPYSWNGYYVDDIHFHYQHPENVDMEKFFQATFVFDQMQY